MMPSLSIMPDPTGDESVWGTRWLCARWPRVQIDLVAAVPSPGGTLVRAVVQLGELTPADVHVELLDRVSDDATGAHAARPMWSSQSYDNGSFVFEASVASTAAPSAWRVRVRPRTIAAPPVENRAVVS